MPAVQHHDADEVEVMSFVRIDKPAGGPADAVDQALAMARERLQHQYSTPNARIGPAASLITCRG